MKRPLTDEERKDLRALIDILYQLEARVKNPKTNLAHGELRGGIFPFLVMLGNLLFTAARVAIPIALRAAVQVGTRLLPSVARGAVGFARTASRGIGRAVARTATNARGLLTRGATRGLTKGTTQTGRSLAGQSVKRGLLNKIGKAATLSGATGVIDMVGEDEMPIDEVPPDESGGVPAETQPQEEEFPVEGDTPPDEGGTGGEGDGGEEEAPTAFNLAPLRYTPRVRNVFTAAQSRNPLSTARQISTYTATPASQPVRPRDIGVFRGAGVIHRRRVLKKYGLEDKGYSVEELAEITGVPRATLQEVYNRGIGAYKTNPRSVRMKVSFAKNVDAPPSKKLSKEQWAMARVYSFLNNNPKHDNDLR